MVENGRDLFAGGGQTNGFSQFKIDSICLPMIQNCGSFSVGPVDRYRMLNSVVLT